MRKLLGLAVFVLLACSAHSAFSASSANQTVTYEVAAITEFSVSGNPSALIVNAATAGSQPTAATDATTSYSITTNASNKKITGVLNTAMPANTSLKVTLASTGGTSAGQVTLTASAQDLVTGLSTLAESGSTITYEFSATVSAGVVASASKTVTLTVADGA